MRLPGPVEDEETSREAGQIIGPSAFRTFDARRYCARHDGKWDWDLASHRGWRVAIDEHCRKIRSERAC
jgi:hypothetical protein